MATPGQGEAKRAPRVGWLRPRTPLPAYTRLAISVSGVLVLLFLWLALTATGLVPAFFLPSPGAVVGRAVTMFRTDGYGIDVAVSTGRVFAGFGLAVALAVPLGVLMGNLSFFNALLEPMFGAARYLPATAFIPLLIIWLGIDESQKIAVIFLGTFFPLVLMVADASASVRREVVDIAATLGATPRQILVHVLLPGALPSIMDQLRVTMGIAWTYVIVAELVGAQRGIGIAILQSQRFLLTDAVIAGIVVVGVLGVATDWAFRMLHRRLFPYAN